MSTEKTMLIVDDSRMSRMMIRAIVAGAHPGWEIIEAGGGDEALEKTCSTMVDIASIDLNMPGMDGLELSRRLLDRFPSARISLLTANIQDSVRERALALGISFIAKPITEEKILGFVSDQAA